MRNDGRKANQLRPLSITPSYIKTADGSVLIEMGDTQRRLHGDGCEERVPPHLMGQGQRVGHRRVRHAAAALNQRGRDGARGLQGASQTGRTQEIHSG